jgi:hypothetical protein
LTRFDSESARPDPSLPRSVSPTPYVPATVALGRRLHQHRDNGRSQVQRPAAIARRRQPPEAPCRTCGVGSTPAVGRVEHALARARFRRQRGRRHRLPAEPRSGSGSPAPARGTGRAWTVTVAGGTSSWQRLGQHQAGRTRMISGLDCFAGACHIVIMPAGGPGPGASDRRSP